MTKPLKPFAYKDDGKTHINIYSKGKTILGRSLSNFAFHRFVHDELGQFSSIEGLYYYLSTGKTTEGFRRLIGQAAKKLGKNLPRIAMDKAEFERLLRMGCRAVYRDDPTVHDMILDQIIENKGEVLPFTHYYSFSDNSIKFPTGNEFFIDEWTKIRLDAITQAGGEITGSDGELSGRIFVTGIIPTA